LQLRPHIAAAALALILLAAGLLRLTSPAAWPVFCDEDNYAFAVAQMRAQPVSAWVREVARCCAKPPLVLMAAVPLGRALDSDLVALRVLSGLGGIVTVAGCFVLGRKLGGTAAGLATAALYALSPWAVLHERMALLDGPVAALVLVAALAAWEAVERSSWRLALCAALLGAAAVWAKQPGLLASSRAGAGRRRPWPASPPRGLRSHGSRCASHPAAIACSISSPTAGHPSEASARTGAASRKP
jgi:4-amino-4-deoxy-L-arabinose transferase-like glycosyltransferase